jgi:EAL domain-containing protein (putative c-di-GMP-specific phosphodiesterase class I)
MSMGLLSGTIPIESDDHVLRARRTAACTRIVMGVIGVLVIVAQPSLLAYPALGMVGFAVIGLTSVVQFAGPPASWLRVEESLSGIAGVLIVGLGSQRVDVLSILWLVAVASGVLARGGRVHWLGRYIVLTALVMPIVRYGSISAEYAALCIAALGLLLTSGRLTRELNHLLMKARLQAESAETLLLAGDIAARMGELGEHASAVTPAPAGDTPAGLSAAELASARSALEKLLAGDGLSMVVQPIVDIRSGTIHAFEALARFGQPRQGASPLHWFSLADQLGERPNLERACLRQALELHARRPPGTSLTVNLSAPVLLEEETMAILEDVGDHLSDDLAGLIVEITEETLVHGDMQLLSAIEPLCRRGARLAVDDMGAGYSGLRQITTVHPAYLKLDRSLVAGIDGDDERAALVGALAGYSAQVGCMLVAEGVETHAELQIVRRLGVPLVQGFLLSRPGPAWPEVSAADARGDLAARAPESVHEMELAGDVERIAALQPVA